MDFPYEVNLESKQVEINAGFKQITKARPQLI